MTVTAVPAAVADALGASTATALGTGSTAALGTNAASALGVEATAAALATTCGGSADATAAPTAEAGRSQVTVAVMGHIEKKISNAMPATATTASHQNNGLDAPGLRKPVAVTELGATE